MSASMEMVVALACVFTLANLGILMMSLKLYTEFAKERFKGDR